MLPKGSELYRKCNDLIFCAQQLLFKHHLRDEQGREILPIQFRQDPNKENIIHNLLLQKPSLYRNYDDILDLFVRMLGRDSLSPSQQTALYLYVAEASLSLNDYAAAYHFLNEMMALNHSDTQSALASLFHDLTMKITAEVSPLSLEMKWKLICLVLTYCDSNVCKPFLDRFKSVERLVMDKRASSLNKPLLKSVLETLEIYNNCDCTYAIEEHLFEYARPPSKPNQVIKYSNFDKNQSDFAFWEYAIENIDHRLPIHQLLFWSDLQLLTLLISRQDMDIFECKHILDQIPVQETNDSIICFLLFIKAYMETRLFDVGLLDEPIQSPRFDIKYVSQELISNAPELMEFIRIFKNRGHRQLVSTLWDTFYQTGNFIKEKAQSEIAYRHDCLLKASKNIDQLDLCIKLAAIDELDEHLIVVENLQALFESYTPSVISNHLEKHGQLFEKHKEYVWPKLLNLHHYISHNHIAKLSPLYHLLLQLGGEGLVSVIDVEPRRSSANRNQDGNTRPIQESRHYRIMQSLAFVR